MIMTYMYSCNHNKTHSSAQDQHTIREFGPDFPYFENEQNDTIL